MSDEQFRMYKNDLKYRDKYLDEYKADILALYEANEYRTLNMASVYDYLEEKHGLLPASERNLRNYIHFLLTTGKLSLNENVRVFQKVSELPLGRQMQVDFGQYKTHSGLKLYIFAAILSASRYRYVSYQSRPFTTIDVIRHTLDCFDYFGGIPLELVIDQDKLMVVSENKGDILYTKDFSYFIEEMDLKMYVCRKSDPQTKGKVENLIKYVKYNHLNSRDFNCIEQAQESLSGWLTRRANGKISQATKQIPMDLIKQERKHLRSLKNSIFRKEDLPGRDGRIVNDKSLISVDTCSYSVPGDYRYREVEIYQTPFKLYVFNSITGKEIAVHDISSMPGKCIKNREHYRSTKTSSADLRKMVLDMYTLKEWNSFVLINFKTLNRYVRDQCLEAKKYFSKNIDLKILILALNYCLENKTYSFANLKDSYQYFLHEEEPMPKQEILNQNPEVIPDFDVNRRSLNDYQFAINSMGGYHESI
jgi:hypothetical protein